MQRLVGEDFDRLFVTFQRTALRLETRDSYAVFDEADAYHAFLAGEPFDLDWHQPWLAGIRSIVASGREMRRVRLIAEPPTDYQRFELAVTPTNLRAGEDIRILPHSVADLDLPSYDYWIFDQRLAIMHFDDDGLFHGAEMIDDSQTVAEHQAAWDHAFARALPYARYIADHPLDA